MTKDNVNSPPVAYEKLEAKRSAKLGQLTKAFNQIRGIEASAKAVFALKNQREAAEALQRAHYRIIDDLMNHDEADLEKIDEDVEKFTTTFLSTISAIDEKLEAAKEGSAEDRFDASQAELEAIACKLAAVKAFTQEQGSKDLPVNQLGFRMKDLHPLQASYHAAWKKCFDLTDHEGRESLRESLKIFNADFYATLGWFDAIVSASCVTSSAASSASSAPRTGPTPKLPKIELETFDGTATSWVSWRDNFKSLVHNVTSISGAIKFTYLKSTVVDKFSPIKHLIVSDEGYEAAWQAVLDYYDDERRIADSHFTGMLRVKPMENESHDELQRVINNFALHTASLERMKNEKELYRAFVAHLVLHRLDAHTRDLWETENKAQIPQWPALQEFLKDRRKTLSTMPAPRQAQSRNADKSGSKPAGKANTHAATKSATSSGTSNASSGPPNAANARTFKCHMCSANHRLHTCQQFLGLPIPSRLAKVRDWRICSNCFGPHSIASCPSKYKCLTCQERHHSTLHMEAPPAQRASTHSLEASVSSLQPEAAPFLFSSCNMSSRGPGHITLLQTAIVQIQDVHGEWHSARAFLDSGSDSNYVTRSVAEALKVPMDPTHIEANGLGGKRAAVIRNKLTTKIGNGHESFEIELLVTPKVANPMPLVTVDARRLEIPAHLPLADPTFHVPGQIDILIGNEHYGDLLREGIVKLSSGPTMLNTFFGYVLSGSVPRASIDPARSKETRAAHFISTQVHHNTLAELKVSSERFYKLEDYRVEKQFLTDEQAHCEIVFVQKHTRVKQGSILRFKVFLPLKEIITQLVNNFRQALVLFFVLEKRLQRNEILRAAYVKFMRDYIEQGHASEVDISMEPDDFIAFYFPHHAVANPESSTTPTRVVFNGSAKTASGVSYNDAQCVGPQIQSDAFTLGLIFRLHAVVIKADVAKMYRTIEIDESQRRYQRIIWRESPQDPIKVYELNTVTYGTASASFQATRCLKELGIQHQNAFPKAAENLITRFFVDDWISGADTAEEATELALDTCRILDGAGMMLRKFCSNNNVFLQSIPEERREEIQEGKLMKALGIYWDPVPDVIRFVVNPVKFDKITRRTILSEIHRLYDPEGLLGPVTFRFKLFLKRVFKLDLPWDAPVPAHDADDWTEIASQFPKLSAISVPRHLVLPRFTDVQLHGFCDASNEGYGACIYVRSRDSAGRIVARLVCSKSRVAPNEFHSIARLELCGAVMLANLMRQVSTALKLKFSKKICWSDSAIALQWLKKLPAQLQTFVANRVSEIQELSTDLVWKHVGGKINPADLISRGLTPLELISCQLWWSGPAFLAQHESKWPKSIVEVDPNEPTFHQEFKKIDSYVHAAVAAESPSADINPFLEMIEKSSRTWAVKRKIAPIMRFLHNIRSGKLGVPRRSGPINVTDMIDAEFALARIYQIKKFPDEYRRCSNLQPVAASSPIKNLDPVWDSSHRLMRVGGRLNNAVHFSEDEKHPIVLPSCHLARLIIREAHQRNLHAGQQTTHGIVRQRFWILRSKNIVRQEVHQCIKCFRVRPRLRQQFMGQLPAERITPSHPFRHTGVDYCGPFEIKLSKLRSAATGKVYVALFICLATKAIHLEIVSDLTTASFFAAFDKFTARRGLPDSMHSDNSTTFVGARNKIRELYEFLQKKSTQEEFRLYLQQQEIEWHFIPSRAPNQGGLWEAGVKSFKHHFYRIVTNALLNFEEFDRLKSRIEAILNSRPLTAISDDPSDLSALTAGHFLVGRPLIALPNRDITPTPINRLQRWDRVVQMQQHFWQRWSRDYLHQLQVRTKNYKDVAPVATGQLVLIHVDNCPPMKWPLGRITRIYPGKDGITRVASIKTQHAKNELQRPVEKLALLPILSEDEQLAPAEDVRG